MAETLDENASKARLWNSKRLAIAVSGVLLVTLLMQHRLQNKVNMLESRKQRVVEEQKRLVREQQLLSQYAPAFDSMVSDGGNPAATRLAWEASIHQIVKQQDAKLEHMVLEAQRQIAHQPSVRGYHLSATAGEVGISLLYESSAYQIIAELMRLPAYATAMESCEIDREVSIHAGLQTQQQVKTAPKLEVVCHFNLYEIKRN